VNARPAEEAALGELKARRREDRPTGDERGSWSPSWAGDAAAERSARGEQSRQLSGAAARE
jgi:hypothetical protein